MPTTLDDFPTLPLTDAHHQQVRALLVREARPAAARRWLAPAAVTASLVAVLAGSQLLGPDGATVPATEPAPPADCAAVQPPGTPADVRDTWRLLPAGATAASVTEVVVHRMVTACGSVETPLEVLAAVQADGTVTAALTLWADAPRPGGWEETSELVSVRGAEAAVMATDRPDAATRLYWSEAGRDLSVTASGLDRSTVLALVDSLTDDGTAIPVDARPVGLIALDGWQQGEEPEPAEPVWTVGYDDDGRRVDIEVSRVDLPWQATLSWASGQRLVDVDGRPGAVTVSGNTWVTYRLDDGAQVTLRTDDPGVGPDRLVDLARSLEPVAADDPRLAPDAP